MHNDLSRACVRCAVRLPATAARCPCCGNLTWRAVDAIRWLGERDAGRAGTATRANGLFSALLYAPIAIGIPGAGAAAMLFAAAALRHAHGHVPPHSPMAIPLFIWLAAMAFIGAACVGVCAWGVWALVVVIVARFVPAQPKRWLLDVAPLAPPALGANKHAWAVSRPWARLKEQLPKRKHAILAGVVLLLPAEVVMLATSPYPFWSGSGAVEVGTRLAVIVAANILVFTVLAMLLFLVFGVFDLALTRLQAVMYEAAVARKPLTADPLRRGDLQAGVARGGGTPLVAPISGETCIGFRIVGVVDGVRIDDAELAAFHVDTGHGNVDVRGARSVLALATPQDRDDRFDGDAHERLRTWLAARDLPSDLDSAELGEVRLDEGASVRVWGPPSAERAAEPGYREAATLRVIDDSDGLPVLVETDGGRGVY